MFGVKQALARVHMLPSRTSSFRPLTYNIHQLLQLQSFLPAAFRMNHTTSLNSPSMPSSPEIPRILSFWFDGVQEEVQKRWFQSAPTFDDEIRTKFGHLVEQARTNQLDDWTSEPEGSLALIILLDQFSRNIYRGSPESFASDAKALAIAVESIAKEFDRQVSPIRSSFFYLPLMHSESLLGQVAGVSLYEALLARAEKENLPEGEIESVKRSLPFAKRHRDAILKLGRFCARNKVLGRESTQEEEEILKNNPAGF